MGAQQERTAVVHWARGVNGGGASVQPNMTYDGGAVMHGTAVQSIFWGTSWGTYVGDKISGLDSFYSGIGSTAYANTNIEYTDGPGSYVSSSIVFQGHMTDTTSAGRRAPGTSAVLAEVCKELTNPVASRYYPVSS